MIGTESERFFVAYVIAVSSAYILNLRRLEDLVISFTYRINNSGPSIQPYATPHITGNKEELTPLMETNCCRFSK